MVGVVTTSASENSRRRRSAIISRWSIPKKPQRKPRPSVPEDSSSNENAASERRRRPKAERNFGKSSWLSGYIDAHTTGFGSEYPAKAPVREPAFRTESPTRAKP